MSLTAEVKPAQAEVKPRPTLWQLLDSMRAHEAALDDPEFDPVAAVGELRATDAALKKKIDGIHDVLVDLESRADRARKKANEWTAKARARENNAKRLVEYVLREMEVGSFEQLPGVKFMAKRVTHHTPKMIALRTPTPRDALELDDLVEEIPASYEWNVKAVKTALLAELEVKKQNPEYELSPLAKDFAFEFSVKLDFEENDVVVVEPKTPKKKGSKA